MPTRSRRNTRGALALAAALAVAVPSTAFAQDIDVNASTNLAVIGQDADAASAALATLSGNAVNAAGLNFGDQRAYGGDTRSSAEAENTAVVVQGNSGD